MLMKRGWSYYGDMLRDDMMKNHPEINIVDLNLYNVVKHLTDAKTIMRYYWHSRAGKVFIH